MISCNDGTPCAIHEKLRHIRPVLSISNHPQKENSTGDTAETFFNDVAVGALDYSKTHQVEMPPVYETSITRNVRRR